MAKLIGKNKIYCAVFISGRGSNLKSIFRYSKKKISKIILKLVVSNNLSAPGVKFAKKNKIITQIVNYENKIKAEKEMLNLLKQNDIKLICLAGFLKILSKNFIKNFKGKIINIHPSLLPKYKGLSTFKRALNAGEKITGCTVHFVDEKLDNGRFILKKRVWIDKKDTPEILKRKVQAEEYKVYSFAIRKIYNYI